jgi:hypothetical protein
MKLAIPNESRPAVASPWFHYATGLLVLGNFVVMCLYLPGEATSRSKLLHIIELTLAGVFLAECILRIVASGAPPPPSCWTNIEGPQLHYGGVWSLLMALAMQSLLPHGHVLGSPELSMAVRIPSCALCITRR